MRVLLPRARASLVPGSAGIDQQSLSRSMEPGPQQEGSGRRETIGTSVAMVDVWALALDTDGTPADMETHAGGAGAGPGPGAVAASAAAAAAVAVDDGEQEQEQVEQLAEIL